MHFCRGVHRVWMVAFGIFCALGLMMGSVDLGEAKVSWVVASKFPETSIQGKYYQVFADAVNELSAGEFEVTVFPSETLGGTQAILDQLQAGIIHLYPEGTGYLERFYRPFAIFELPFVFDSPEHWLRFFNSELVAQWRQELHKFSIDAIHLQVLDPYRVMVTTRPVESLEDLQGLNLRMFPNETVIRVWEYLGANIRVIEWTDVYEALRTGLVEGVTGGVAGVYDMAFHEPAPYILQTHEYPQGVAWMVNHRAYESLSEEQKEILRAAFARAAEWVEANYAAETEKRIRDQVENYGVRYVRVGMGPWRDRVWEFYRQLEADGTIPAGTLDYIASLR